MQNFIVFAGSTPENRGSVSSGDVRFDTGRVIGRIGEPIQASGRSAGIIGGDKRPAGNTGMIGESRGIAGNDTGIDGRGDVISSANSLYRSEPGAVSEDGTIRYGVAGRRMQTDEAGDASYVDIQLGQGPDHAKILLSTTPPEWQHGYQPQGAAGEVMRLHGPSVKTLLTALKDGDGILVAAPTGVGLTRSAIPLTLEALRTESIPALALQADHYTRRGDVSGLVGLVRTLAGQIRGGVLVLDGASELVRHEDSIRQLLEVIGENRIKTLVADTHPADAPYISDMWRKAWQKAAGEIGVQFLSHDLIPVTPSSEIAKQLLVEQFSNRIISPSDEQVLAIGSVRHPAVLDMLMQRLRMDRKADILDQLWDMVHEQTEVLDRILGKEAREYLYTQVRDLKFKK
jgi:hypothetical protein